MKIQNLAVIFIVIILPISLVISTYTGYQVQTVSMQSSYDSKLLNATYDAVKAYQLNSASSATSDIANSKLRDIEAAANTFYNSVATNFNMKGYDQETLKEYVPSVVFTMYDGMYLYSSYKNHLNSSGKNGADETDGESGKNSDNDGIDVSSKATYHNNQDMYGLKPYIYYSCRYKDHDDPSSSLDIVITYSLDNYISIQGTDRVGNPVNIQGYLLSDVNKDPSDNNKVIYRGVEIESEDNIRQNIIDNNSIPINCAEIGPSSNTLSNGDELISCYCRKVDGAKYYKEAEDKATFTSLNNVYLEQNNGLDVIQNTNAVLYYKEALELKEAINRDMPDLNDPTAPVLDLANLKVSDAIKIDENGNEVQLFGNDDTKIFEGLFTATKDNGETTIEEPNSNFNQHRLQVIRKTVEDNLSIALENYNNSLGSHEFQMPKLKEDDWDKILNNIAVITFLQGVNIGGKVYNGYAIVPNNENEDVVTESSIYIIGNDDQYHSVTEKDLESKLVGLPGKEATATGVLNADFEAHSIVGSDKINSQYYIPKGSIEGINSAIYGVNEYGDYGSIITSQDISEDYDGNMYKYIDSRGGNLAKIYYTALARERYGTYKGARFVNDILASSSSSSPGDLNNSITGPGATDISIEQIADSVPNGTTGGNQNNIVMTPTGGPVSSSSYNGKVTKFKIDIKNFCWPQKALDTEIPTAEMWGIRVPGHTANCHDGIDVQQGREDPILAVADGTVTVAQDYASFGNYVRIDHTSDGNGLFTFYGHMSRLVVSKGQKVEKGDIIRI